MNVKWSCSACKKIETTGPNVKELSHVHAGKVYQLSSFKKTRKAPGVVTVKSLKSETWDIFSEYIRRRHADENGYAKCVTCGRSGHWKDMQAGHYISRQYNMTLFDERNVHPQCPYCNGPLKGNIPAYQDFMIRTYGQDVIDELFRLAKVRHKFTVRELQGIKDKYSALVRAL